VPEQSQIIAVSAVIATRNRPQPLARTLQSLTDQSACPTEILIIDGSNNDESKTVAEIHASKARIGTSIKWQLAKEVGAAAQRNEGVRAASQPFILFCDDDIVFQPECVIRIWNAIFSDPALGGVNAMIVNQSYHPPGTASRIVLRVMNGAPAKTFAGKVIGPAVNLLPEDREDLPEVVPVEWLNTTCTMYRREALPNPPFPARFTGYSLMEDIALSLEVGKKWKLANARTARIFHDSQPADYKSDQRLLSRMLVTNRHFVMTEILNKRSLTDYGRFALWELFQLFSVVARRKTRGKALAMLRGQLEGFAEILSSRA
jgi:glycosyltransferase involved in cell wall biosynthesis